MISFDSEIWNRQTRVDEGCSYECEEWALAVIERSAYCSVSLLDSES